MTEKIKRGFSYLKGKISSGLKHLKGVSKGGEEFTHKLDKILQPANKKEKPLPRPKFIHGKMGEVVNKIDSNKPFLLYISGDDSSSHHFETNILTQPVIIKIMDDHFECLGLISTSSEGKLVMQKLEQETVPVVLVIKIVKEKNISDIKYMLDGENLIHDDGKEYKLFLK